MEDTGNFFKINKNIDNEHNRIKDKEIVEETSQLLISRKCFPKEMVFGLRPKGRKQPAMQKS